MVKKVLLVLSLVVMILLPQIVLSYSVSELQGAIKLGKLGIIVDRSVNPTDFQLDQNVLRQEIAGIITSVACIPKKSICENKFYDVSANNPNLWACYSVEALLDNGVIAPNFRFRPLDTISKAEAVGMIVKAVYGDEYQYNPNLGTTWQLQVVTFAVRKGIVELFIDFDMQATRGFVFNMASKAIQENGSKCNLWNDVNDSDNGGYNLNDIFNPTPNNNNSNTNNNNQNDFEDVGIVVKDITRVSCNATTIDQYKIPALVESRTYLAEKVQEITYGTRIEKQRFICENGTTKKTGEAYIGLADCKNGVNRHETNPTLCYVKPPTGGRRPAPGVCGTMSNTGAIYGTITKDTVGMCTTGRVENLLINDTNWVWTCTGVDGGASVAGCSIGIASCGNKPYTGTGSENIIYTEGTPTAKSQAWQNINSSNACYYKCSEGYTGETCNEKIVSCANIEKTENAQYTIGSPTEQNQVWQSEDSEVACYYECNEGYSGDNCAIQDPYCAEIDTELYPNIESYEEGSPTEQNQVWQSEDSEEACYYKCSEGYEGEYCADEIILAVPLEDEEEELEEDKEESKEKISRKHIKTP